MLFGGGVFFGNTEVLPEVVKKEFFDSKMVY